MRFGGISFSNKIYNTKNYIHFYAGSIEYRRMCATMSIGNTMWELSIIYNTIREEKT
jgi:hypothetical protein